MMSSVQHYNRVAREPPAQCRELRTAHRAAKHVLISSAAALSCGSMKGCHILDFACGRGGDLTKCVGCASYTGVDTAEEALRELHRRAEEMHIPVTTHHADASCVPVTPCDTAMCNFALHYFCDTEQHCAALLDKVSQCLRPGGTLCGTYEKRVGLVQWGDMHHAVVGDCVNAIEWRVPWNCVVRMALKRGLALVYHMPLHCLHNGSDQSIWCFIMRAQGQHCGKKEKAQLTADTTWCRQAPALAHGQPLRKSQGYQGQ